jgi:ubiquitin-protein ligase
MNRRIFIAYCNMTGTDWAGGKYKLKLEFPDEYPSKVYSIAFTMNSFLTISSSFN